MEFRWRWLWSGERKRGKLKRLTGIPSGPTGAGAGFPSPGPGEIMVRGQESGPDGQCLLTF